MLEGQFGLVIDEPAGHHQVTCNPLGAVGFERLDFVLGGPVKFLTRDIVVDLGRTFAIGTVRAAQVTRIRYAYWAVLSLVASPELAGA